MQGGQDVEIFTEIIPSPLWTIPAEGEGRCPKENGQHSSDGVHNPYRLDMYMFLIPERVFYLYVSTTVKGATRGAVVDGKSVWLQLVFGHKREGKGLDTRIGYNDN